MTKRSRTSLRCRENELRAQLLATFQAPLQSFVALLQAPPQNFVYALAAKEREGQK